MGGPLPKHSGPSISKLVEAEKKEREELPRIFGWT
jgi:hypothetical protein